jgi:hypothetical protein
MPESATVPTTPPAHAPGVNPEGKAPEVAGSVVGAGAGAALGIAGGPVGMIVGALAGAVGGWWAIDKITEGAYDENEDLYYRQHYETSDYQLADRRYEDVRPAYAYGHLAAHNPAYSDRGFDDAKGDLEREWTAGLRGRYGEWARAWRYAQVGYDRGRQRRSGVTGSQP